MSEFKQFRRKGVVELRPWVPSDAENKKISISQADVAEIQKGAPGMVARNPDNHEDMWYVSREYFLKNYEEA